MREKRKGVWHFFDMTHVMTTLALIFSVNLAFANPISVSVKLGFGRAQVVTVPPIDNTEMQNIQTELLVSTSLSKQVMAEETREYHFVFGGPVTAAEIERQILANPNGANAPQFPTFNVQVDSDLSQRFFIGQTGRIEAGDKIGELIAMGSDVEIYGEVVHLIAMGSTITIKPGGKIIGNIESFGSDIKVEDGGQAPQNQGIYHWERGLFNPLTDWFQRPSSWEFWGFKIIIFLFAGMFIQRVFPLFHSRVENLIYEQFWAAWGWGFAASALLLPGLVVLVMTIVGIAIIPLVLFFYLFGAIYGYVVLGLFVVRSLGLKIAKLAALPFGVRLLLGILILQLVGAITGLSWFFVWFAALAGFGAFGVGLVKTLARRRKPGTSVPAV